jgi:PAS domain S-box-containing protein
MKDVLFQALAKTGDGAFVTDEDQRIIFWNQAATEITGYTYEEIPGQPCYEVLEGRDDQGWLFCFEQGGDVRTRASMFSGLRCECCRIN